MNEKKFRIKMKEVKGSAGSNLPPRSPSDRQKKLTGDHEDREDREDRVSSTKTCRYPAPANYQNLSPRLNLSFPWIEKMKVQKHHYPPPPPSSSSSSFLLLFFFFFFSSSSSSLSLSPSPSSPSSSSSPSPRPPPLDPKLVFWLHSQPNNLQVRSSNANDHW